MSEQEQSSSQLSALFDGELPPQQAEMVIRRALREPALRMSWERYSLIGACLRAEPLCAGGSIADRVQARLAGERELNVTTLPQRGRLTTDAPRFSLFGRGALGGAIAAGVAVVSIFVVRAVAPVAGDAGVQMAAVAAPAAVTPAQDSAGAQLALADGAPGSYTTPGANAPVQRRMVDASLGYYLVAHSEEAASALRSSYDLVHGGVELTEEEIRALR